MTGEINSFRSRFFGGFNKEDVADYITKIANERNEFEKAKNKAEDDVRVLSLEIERLRTETEEVRRLIMEDYENKANTFELAGKTFNRYGDAFKVLCAEIGSAATSVFTELKSAGEITGKLPPLLAEAVERIEELRVAFEEDKDIMNDKDEDIEQ